MFLALLLLAVLVPSSQPQCLTASDKIKPISIEAHQALIQGEREFAAKLLETFGTLYAEDENVFFSPSSIYNTMLLAYFMSANHTEAQLRKALKIPENMDKVDMMGAYHLESYYQKLRNIQKDYQLSSANRIYLSKHLPVKACMRTLFADELVEANFQDNYRYVLRRINKWVAAQTRNVIKNFLSKDSVTSETKLVLANAAYFKGTWEREFVPADTYERKFHLTDGPSVPTTMMYQENRFRMRTDPELRVKVLELPYTGNDISMFVLLPLEASTSAIPQLVQQLTSDTLRRTLNTTWALTPHKVAVSIPKFTVEVTTELKPILEAMRVGDIFRSTADFSTLARSSLSFSDAIHKAKIQVDEKGTEAAAATALISARIGVDTFTADHPFIYFLYDKVSEIALFSGIFNSP